MSLIRRLYDWTLEKARHRHAGAWLGIVSFLESSIFPVPPDVLLAPMVLARRERAFAYWLNATVTSILGAVAGYYIGLAFWEAIGQPVMEFYGYQDAFREFQAGFVEYGAWLVFFFGITFFPFKVITIASGVVALDMGVFLVASLLARGIRFGLVTALLYRFGPPVQAFIEKRLGLVVTLFFILLIGGVLLVKYAF